MRWLDAYIDPAIGQVDEDGRSSRPGRIDRLIEFGPMAEEERWKVAMHILDGDEFAAKQLVEEGEGGLASRPSPRVCGTSARVPQW